jgi:hypothetical protein
LTEITNSPASTRVFADPGGRRRTLVIVLGTMAALALVAWLAVMVVGLSGTVDASGS